MALKVRVCAFCNERSDSKSPLVLAEGEDDHRPWAQYVVKTCVEIGHNLYMCLVRIPICKMCCVCWNVWRISGVLRLIS